MTKNALKCNLQNLLDTSFLCKSDKFEEKDNQVKMEVPIYAAHIQHLLCSFDKKWGRGEAGLFPFFKKNSGNHKMCDYILFCEGKNKKLYVLLIELKHGRNSVTPQLNAGECFAKFVIDTLNRVENKNYNPIIRKIAIRGAQIKLKPTTKVKPVSYDGSGFCTFSGNTFYLAEFIK